MSEEVVPEWLAAMRRPAVYPDYAFTEIRTFHIPEELVLEDAVSAAGSIWANTIRTYLEDGRTKLLWWGRLHEEPQVVKFVVGTFCSFISSEHFAEKRCQQQIGDKQINMPGSSKPHSSQNFRSHGKRFQVNTFTPDHTSSPAPKTIVETSFLNPRSHPSYPRFLRSTFPQTLTVHRNGKHHGLHFQSRR